MILSMEQFGDLFSSFEESAFRIETLPVYSVDEERDAFAAFLEGEPFPPNENEEWASFIKNGCASGKQFARVHVIDKDISAYLRFEIENYYVFNNRAGEDIRFVFRDDVTDLTYTDTWLFDDRLVVDLSYTVDGELLYVNQNDHPDRLNTAQQAWRVMYGQSFDLRTVLGKLRSAPVTID